MSNSQINNLASEIVLAKSAASSATAKVTRLLNDVYSIKSFNLDISNNILNLNNQINNINQLLNNLSLDGGDFVTKDQFNSDISNILLEINNIKQNSTNIDGLLETNLAFLSSQDVLLKNDVNYNSSLIDNNNTYIQRLESKLNNLVNILNNQTNLNININTL